MKIECSGGGSKSVGYRKLFNEECKSRLPDSEAYWSNTADKAVIYGLSR